MNTKQSVIPNGKGGTDKTTATAALAHLASRECAIVLVDADVDATSLELVLDPTRLEIQAFADCAELSTEVVGRIPYDNVVTEAMVHGLPVTEYTDGPVAEAIEQAWAQTRTRLLSGGKDSGAGM